jgi:Rod binding domain-containing protein
MTTIGGLSPAVPSTGLPGSAKADSAKLAHAAGQFEALLLGEMLKSASSEGWMGGSEDQSCSSLSEMAQEQFAQALADSGGLGIAKMITGAIRPDAKKATPASSPGTPAVR